MLHLVPSDHRPCPSCHPFSSRSLLGAYSHWLCTSLVNRLLLETLSILPNFLSVNLRESESQPQLLLASRIIFKLMSSAKRLKHKIEDIIAWSQAVFIFSLILTTHFPLRWRNLTLYKLLDLHIFCKVQGNAWMAYDGVLTSLQPPPDPQIGLKHLTFLHGTMCKFLCNGVQPLE